MGLMLGGAILLGILVGPAGVVAGAGAGMLLGGSPPPGPVSSSGVFPYLIKKIDKGRLDDLKYALKNDKKKVDQYSSSVDTATWKQVRKNEVVLELDGKDYVTGRGVKSAA
jgi:hypothetical protein